MLRIALDDLATIQAKLLVVVQDRVQVFDPHLRLHETEHAALAVCTPTRRDWHLVQRPWNSHSFRERVTSYYVRAPHRRDHQVGSIACRTEHAISVKYTNIKLGCTFSFNGLFDCSAAEAWRTVSAKMPSSLLKPVRQTDPRWVDFEQQGTTTNPAPTYFYYSEQCYCYHDRVDSDE